MKTRAETLAHLREQTFDLLVIGGVATGAGIALDAATRGLRAALIEKEDFAFGTSSRSTKLIHGGLRYLKQFEIGLVREVGLERAIVHRNAPHLVIPEKMLLPLIRGGQYGKFMTAIGLTVYDLLARVAKPDRRRMLSKEKTLQKEPLLDASRLKGGGHYAEYRTDDARLTVALIRTAIEASACCANYVSAEGFEKAEGQVTGVLACDALTQETFPIQAKQVVNATGPWVDELREKDGSRSGKGLHLTKGVHLVVSHERLPVQQSIYFDVPDGRMIFAIPRGAITYIGTTDTTYEEDISHPKTSKADANYLLDAVNAFFPEVTLTLADVQSTWAGLRPLIHEDGKSPSELSRKDEIFESPDGLISIAGGKLTGYRKMAERVVDRVVKRLPNQDQDCSTATRVLASGPFKDSAEVDAYINTIQERFKGFGINDATNLATTFVQRYGRDVDVILGHAQEQQQQASESPETVLLRAEVWFTVTHEMVQRASDFCVRRSGRLYFARPQLTEQLPIILEALQKHLDWSDQRRSEEQQAMEVWFDEVSIH